MLVSVIVPVYKVEKWISRCIESVLNQTMPDYELILVDDGSPDECPSICDEYSDKYKNIRVIHKSNGGLASARNVGMKAAEGKYLFFLDSDDWIDPNTLEELVDVAEKENVDFVRFRPMYANWPGHRDGELCDFGTEAGMTEGFYDRNRIVSEIFPRLIVTPQMTMGPIVAAWRSLYRSSFLIGNNLFFDEQVRYSEDSIFSAKVVYQTKSFYYLDGARYYHYFYNNESITKSFKPGRWESCKNLIDCFDQIFMNKEDYDFQNQLRLERIFCVLVALGQRSLLKDDKIRKEYCREICNDPVTVDACSHLKLVRVSWKLMLQLILVKYKQIWLLEKI